MRALGRHDGARRRRRRRRRNSLSRWAATWCLTEAKNRAKFSEIGNRSYRYEDDCPRLEPEVAAAGNRPMGQRAWMQWAARSHVGIGRFFVIYIFLIVLKNYTTIWNFCRFGNQPPNRRAPRRLGTNRRSAPRLEAGHSVLRRPTAVGPNRRGPRRLEWFNLFDFNKSKGNSGHGL
jgi:hypothetical protein